MFLITPPLQDEETYGLRERSGYQDDKRLNKSIGLATPVGSLMEEWMARRPNEPATPLDDDIIHRALSFLTFCPRPVAFVVGIGFLPRPSINRRTFNKGKVKVAVFRGIPLQDGS